MHDDELGQLIQRSLDRHVDDVHPSPDLGEWVIERGRVVRRQRRTAAVAGGAATLALVAGAAILVPRLGQGPSEVVPAGTSSTRPATPSPRPTSSAAQPRPTAAHVAPTDIPTVYVTRTARPTSTAGDPTPSESPSATESPTSTPSATESPTTSAPAGPTFDTPYGPVGFPTGTSAKLSGTRSGDHYLALVGAETSPNQARLLRVDPDGSAVVLVSAGNGSIRSWDVSPNGRFVAVAIHEGEERLEVSRITSLGTEAAFTVPSGWEGEIIGWSSEGITLRSPSGRELTWSFDTGHAEGRESPDATPVVLVP